MKTESIFRQDDSDVAYLSEAEQLMQLAQDGWLQASIDTYATVLQQSAEMQSLDHNATRMRLWYDAHRIGSDLFTKMLTANFKPSQANAAMRIGMLEKIMGLSVDAENFVQMTRLGLWSERGNTTSLYYLYIGDTEQFKSYINFANTVARLMYAKYQIRAEHFFGHPSMAMLNDIYDHQLRYYIGKPFIDYLKRQNVTRNDVKTLAQSFLHRQIKYPDARYHNRGVSDASNLKIVTPDYHLEVILDKHDEVVSMWCALETHQMVQLDGSVLFDSRAATYTLAELQQIANTESLNYANHGGAIHDLLDGDPSVRGVGYEPKIRDYAKTLF